MTATVFLTLTLTADGTLADTGPDFGKASPFGLLVVVVLLIATFFLVASMNRHLRKLPESFDRESDQATDAAAADPTNPAQESGGQPSD